jgi:hypothetical protein
MFYQEVKSARAAAIGTIMPWTGAISDIPKGWIFCNGQTVTASEYPLLVQAIGDTYNAGTSDLGGSFPNYSGSIVLPSLNGKALMDLEDSYFASRASGGTGRAADTNTEARTIISPYIGTNSDNSIPVIFNDVYTDVIFTLNDRTGYGGRIRGATIQTGEASRTVYIAPRKLGRNHLRSHRHSGSYDTISRTPDSAPGDGVIPWDNMEFKFGLGIQDVEPGPQGDVYGLNFQMTRGQSWTDIESRTGFGSGQAGRTVAAVWSENPPVNLFPQSVRRTPIAGALQDARLNSGRTVSYGIGGGTVTVPTGFSNFYSDLGVNTNYGTLNSHPAFDFNVNTGAIGFNPVIEPHNNDEIDVTFITGNLRPQSSLTANANIPATTTLDNNQNRSVLQINFNTSQPGLNCIYVIRAY